MIKYLVSLTLFSLFINGCTNQKENVESLELQEMKPVDKEELSSLTNVEKDFNDFLNTFNTDTVFQKAHIAFPLFYDAGIIDGKPYTSTIEKEDWMLVDLGSKEEEIILSRFLTVNADTTTLVLESKQNKIYYQYTFVRKADTWILSKFLDYSG